MEIVDCKINKWLVPYLVIAIRKSKVSITCRYMILLLEYPLNKQSFVHEEMVKTSKLITYQPRI